MFCRFFSYWGARALGSYTSAGGGGGCGGGEISIVFLTGGSPGFHLSCPEGLKVRTRSIIIHIIMTLNVVKY